MVHRWLVIGIAIWAMQCARPAWAIDQAKVDEAIRRGIERLWEDQEEDGRWIYDLDREDRDLGITALAALALYENGVFTNDARFRRALQFVRKNCIQNTDTYSVSLATILLARVGQREDRILVRSLTSKLVAGQLATGAWGYKVPFLTSGQERDPARRTPPEVAMGDFSVTQFAVLALWQAQRVGARVEDSLRSVRLRLAWAQTENGGWNYYGIPDMSSKDTMTAAGTFMWVVTSAWEIKEGRENGRERIVAREPRPRRISPRAKLREQLLEEGELSNSQINERLDKIKEPPPADIYDALQRAVPDRKDALDTFKPGTRPGQIDYEYPVRLPPVLEATKGSPLENDKPLADALKVVGRYADFNKLRSGTVYYPWSVERLGVLLGTQHFGSIDWFEVGGTTLLQRQNQDGSWGIRKDDRRNKDTHYKYGPDTCFALLFLKKANLGSDVTRLLHPDPENPFAIENRQGAEFKTFKEAIEGAKDGETIVIHGDGPFTTVAQTIDKAITIRAAQGYEPVLNYERPKSKLGFEVDFDKVPNAQVMLMLKDKRITFEGLRIQMDPPSAVEADWTMIRAEGTDLRLLNCTLSESLSRNTTALDLRETPRVFVRNGFFIGFSPAFRVQTGSQTNIMLKDCVAYGPTTFSARGTGGLNVWLVESTLNASTAFDLGGLTGDVYVGAENNVLRSEKLIADFGAGKRTWDGQKNLYDSRIWIAKGPEKTTSVRNLDDWKRQFGTEEYRSTSTQAAFAVYRPQMGGFRHTLSPQEWALNNERLHLAMRISQDDQIGANVYVVGAGAGYLEFREKLDYNGWLKVTLPSERESEPASQ